MAQLAWGLDEEVYYEWANQNMMCVVIIEEGEAAANVDDIAGVGSLDLLFIGTSDLSFSVTGSKANVGSEAVQGCIAKVLAAGKKYGIPVGCPAGNAADMSVLKAQGFTFFQAPPELGLLQKAVADFADSLAESGISSPSNQGTGQKGAGAGGAGGGQVC